MSLAEDFRTEACSLRRSGPIRIYLLSPTASALREDPQLKSACTRARLSRPACFQSAWNLLGRANNSLLLLLSSLSLFCSLYSEEHLAIAANDGLIRAADSSQRWHVCDCMCRGCVCVWGEKEREEEEKPSREIHSTFEVNECTREDRKMTMSMWVSLSLTRNFRAMRALLATMWVYVEGKVLVLLERFNC